MCEESQHVFIIPQFGCGSTYLKNVPTDYKLVNTLNENWLFLNIANQSININ